MLRLHWVTLHRISERPSNILEGITQHPAFEHSFAGLSRFRSPAFSKRCCNSWAALAALLSSTWNISVHAESFKQHMLWGHCGPTIGEVSFQAEEGIVNSKSFRKGSINISSSLQYWGEESELIGAGISPFEELVSFSASESTRIGLKQRDYPCFWEFCLAYFEWEIPTTGEP